VISELGSGPEALGGALRRIAGELEPGAPPMVVVAPFFALEGLELPHESLVFANNFLAQGLKLSGVKAAFNRTVCRLLHFEPEALDSFPLLSRRDGVFVADLGLLPEKYRLDPGRCEELLERFLGAWLEAIDGEGNGTTH
jgi:hypothetical protein